MDRRIYLNLQGGRAVSGVLRGFDVFLNLVVEQAVEELKGGQKKNVGMVVSLLSRIRSLLIYEEGVLTKGR